MAELKTKPTIDNIQDFLNTIEDTMKRQDSEDILRLMKEITKEKAVMWGGSIIGFGTYHYKHESGKEGDWFILGFSPRKQNISLYIMNDFDKNQALLKKLGKYKTTKACLHIDKLEDINIDVLKKIIFNSYNYLNNK